MAKNPLNTLGATNLSKSERSALDYYGTDPVAVQDLLDREKFQNYIWEPTAGHHNIVDVLEAEGYSVRKSDIFDYGFGDELIDFLSEGNSESFAGDICMNPPYKEANEFVAKAISLVKPGCKVAAFLRLLFLEGQKRYEQIFKDNPPKVVYVFSKRQVCSKVDDFTEGSAVAYCWCVWEKGFKGDPIIKWIY
jgi:hypothetical protein